MKLSLKPNCDNAIGSRRGRVMMMEPVFQKGKGWSEPGVSRYDGEMLQSSWLHRLTIKVDEIAIGVVFWIAVLFVCCALAIFWRIHGPTKLELAQMRYQSEGLVDVGEGVCERPYAIAPYTVCHVSFDGEPPHEWTCTARGCFHRPE